MRIKDIMLGLSVCCAFSLVSCSDDEFTETQSSLTVTSAETSIEAAGGARQIHVSGPLASVYSPASWLTVSQEGSVVNVTAVYNPDVQSRNTIVVMKASENDSTIVNISQSGARYEFEAPEKLTMLGHGKSEAVLDVMHTIPVFTTPSDSWISATVTDDALIISCEPNAGGTSRTGYIDVKLGYSVDRIEIVQHDICGEYMVTGTDFRNSPVSLPGTLKGGATGNELMFCPDRYNGEISVPMTYDPVTSRVSLSASSYCGMSGEHYVYTVLISSRNTQMLAPETVVSGALEPTADGQFSFCLNEGQQADGSDIAGIRIRAFASQPPVLSNGKTTLVDLKSPLFVRTSAGVSE